MIVKVNKAFVGTDQIGAEYAEREALFFASLWRLSINLNTPTVFRSDSMSIIWPRLKQLTDATLKGRTLT